MQIFGQMELEAPTGPILILGFALHKGKGETHYPDVEDRLFYDLIAIQPSC